MTAIQEKHALLLRNAVDLGDLIGGEESTPDGGSRQAYQFGVIYFHPRIGTAFECHDLILRAYVEQGEQAGGLGYPTSDEEEDPDSAGGRLNRFEGGTIFLSPASDVTVRHAVHTFVREVTLKISDAFPLGLEKGQTLGLDQLGALVGLLPGNPLLEAVRALLPDLVTRRVFDDLTDLQFQELVTRAQDNDPLYQPPVWSNFLFIEEVAGVDTEGLLAALRLWAGVVEFAHRMPTPSDPAVVATTNPFFVGQGYLGAAPTGVGVQAAWARGADGSDTRFVDLEQGWLLKHEDLPPGIPFLGGINNPLSFSHGCAVLGVVVGVDNNRGVVGMAPAALPRVISYFDPKDPKQPFDSKQARARVASRIASAALSLRFGDVLLLEVQFGATVDGKRVLVPVETDVGVFKAIELVVKTGVIVVEAAGNGNTNLDNFRLEGKATLKRNTPDFKESGAIMVGGCSSAVPHQRLDRVDPAGIHESSNFGSRVDCCAWGEHVITSGNRTKTTALDAYWAGPRYEDFFRGTSAAAPIITGMCLLIQNLQTLLPQPGRPGRLGPASMRRMLSNPLNGTTVAGIVGPMPDFKKILANEYAAATLRLHVKVLAEPPDIAIDRMVANANAVYGSHGIEVVEASRETLDAAGTDLARFNTLVVGDRGDGPTAEQADLFDLRAGAGPGDIVVYFVRTLVPACAGSATHPPGRPGLVVSASTATEWTLAHVLGHVLGLEHVNDQNGLMTRRSTSSINNLPPDLSESEVASILAGTIA